MQGVLGAFCALNAAHGSRARREGSGMCSRCPWAAPILVPRPGVPGERPGPAEPLPHTWRAELSQAAAAAAQSRLGSGVRVPAPLGLRSRSIPGGSVGAGRGRGAAAAPQRHPVAPAGNAAAAPRARLIPGAGTAAVSRSQPGFGQAVPRCPAVLRPAERPHWPSLPKCFSWRDTCSP